MTGMRTHRRGLRERSAPIHDRSMAGPSSRGGVDARLAGCGSSIEFPCGLIGRDQPWETSDAMKVVRPGIPFPPASPRKGREAPKGL